MWSVEKDWGILPVKIGDLVRQRSPRIKTMERTNVPLAISLFSVKNFVRTVHVFRAAGKPILLREHHGLSAYRTDLLSR